MGYTSIPCKSETRDRVRELKERGDRYRSWDDVLEEMVNQYEGAE